MRVRSSNNTLVWPPPKFFRTSWSRTGSTVSMTPPMRVTFPLGRGSGAGNRELSTAGETEATGECVDRTLAEAHGVTDAPGDDVPRDDGAAGARGGARAKGEGAGLEDCASRPP